MAAYLGGHGFCLELALRPGGQHSAKEMDFNLDRIIPMAQRLSAAGPKAPLQVRLDSGFDSQTLMRGIVACNQAGLLQVDWPIKWNPRNVNVRALAERLAGDAATVWVQTREGKRITVWQEPVHIEGIDRPLQRVLRLTERTIDARGQQLIKSELTLEGWNTSFRAKFSGADLIALYADHGTHEQFHAEFETDLDQARQPTGKFDTNSLVCQWAALAMNILRLIGQRGLLGPDAPIRHQAKRRRIKTVMQELIYRAGRMIQTGRRILLGLGANDRAATTFAKLHGELFAVGIWRHLAAERTDSENRTARDSLRRGPMCGDARANAKNSCTKMARPCPQRSAPEKIAGYSHTRALALANHWILRVGVTDSGISVLKRPVRTVHPVSLMPVRLGCFFGCSLWP